MFKDPPPASPADAEPQVLVGLKDAESLWHFQLYRLRTAIRKQGRWVI